PRLEEVLGRPVINRYGMTEAHVITSLPFDGPWPQGSVGLPLDGVELRVTRPDGGLAAGDEVGSVQVRGPHLFRGYWRTPEASGSSPGWWPRGPASTNRRWRRGAPAGWWITSGRGGSSSRRRCRATRWARCC